MSDSAVAVRDRGDIECLGALMGEGYALVVFDEPPREGRDDGIEGWRGYCDSFPRYRIVEHAAVATGNGAAVLGHTTGSHLGLPDDDEARMRLIWAAEVRDGRIHRWTLIEDTAENRAACGFDTI